MFDALKHYGRLLLAFLFVVALVLAYQLGAQSARRDVALRDARQAAKTAAADLAAYRAETERLAAIAARVETVVAQARTQTQTRIVEYRTHAQQNPLPADCRLDAGRLRQLNAAIADTNAAIAGDVYRTPGPSAGAGE